MDKAELEFQSVLERIEKEAAEVDKANSDLIASSNQPQPATPPLNTPAVSDLDLSTAELVEVEQHYNEVLARIEKEAADMDKARDDYLASIQHHPSAGTSSDTISVSSSDGDPPALIASSDSDSTDTESIDEAAHENTTFDDYYQQHDTDDLNAFFMTLGLDQTHRSIFLPLTAYAPSAFGMIGVLQRAGERQGMPSAQFSAYNKR
eukprot:3937695-Rhodomonas_salina.1